MIIKFLLSVLGISFIGLLSCQGNNKKAVHISAPDTTHQKSKYVIDTLDIHQYFVINNTKSQLFALPDTNAKLNDFLIKDDFTEASKISGDFIFISHKGDRDTTISAWVLKNTLEPVQMTAPVIIPDDSLN
jgi:hypothetical protein